MMNKENEMKTERPKICTRLPEMRQISALCGTSYACNSKLGPILQKKKKVELSQSHSLEALLHVD